MVEGFLAVLGVSATVGLVALALALLSRPLNRHAAARWKYWVWLVLAVRLLLPFDLALPASLARVELPAAVQQPLAPGAAPASGGAPASAPGGAAENLPAGQVPQAPAPAPAPAVSTREVLAALALVWLAGAALCGVWHLGSSLRFYRRAVRWARPPSAPATRQLWELCRQDLGVRRARLLVNPAVPCPMAAGLFQPTVLLPTEEMDPGDLSCVLRHELTHLKRGDLWYRLVLLAAACLHWFNPLVWLLLRQAWADLELRCDDEVLRAAPPEQRRAYSEAILACIRQGQGRAPVLTTYFRGGKGSLARRFANILTPGKKRGGALVLAATLATAKELGFKRVWAVDQPFTYSRTRALLHEFAEVLSAADRVVLTPIMGSREVDDGSVRSEDLAALIPGCVTVAGLKEAADYIKANAEPGDLVLTLGCGDVYKAARMMLQ